MTVRSVLLFTLAILYPALSAQSTPSIPAPHSLWYAAPAAKWDKMTNQGGGFDGVYNGSYQTLGDLTFGVDFKIGGVAFTRETFSSAADQVLATRIAADRKGSVSFTLDLKRGMSATTKAEGADTLVLLGNTDTKNREGNVDHKARARSLSTGRTGS